MGSPQMVATLILLLIAIPSSQSQDQEPSDPDTSVLSNLQSQAKKELPFLTRERVKEGLNFGKDVITVATKITEVAQVFKSLSKVASQAPGFIGMFFSVVNLGLAFVPQDIPVLREVKKGFAEMNRKLDALSIQISNLENSVEWHTYISKYSESEVAIEVGWKKLQEYQENSMLVESDDEKLEQIEMFVIFYEEAGIMTSVPNLRFYLTTNSVFTLNLNQLLIKKFKCDIKMIGRYYANLNSLLLKGVALEEFYRKLTGYRQPNKKAKLREMFNEIYQAQLNTVQYCLENYETYMKEDVKEIGLQSGNSDKKAIAIRIKEHLDQKYDWYKFVVIVYNTAEDKNHMMYTNYFVKIEVGELSVAVAHTTKGPVPDKSLFSCPSDYDPSCDHAARFQKCNMPDSEPVTLVKYKYFTAAHILHLRSDFAEVPEPFQGVLCDYIWPETRGIIPDPKNHEVYVHYSRREPACDETKCANGGRCKTMLESNDWLCECVNGYYGITCEEKWETTVDED